MELPALYQLMGAYFHEDWDLDGTEEQVVDAFLDGEPQLAAAIPHEVTTVLSAFPVELELEALLDRLGSSYQANPSDGGYRGFLERIGQRARERHPTV